MPSTASTVEAVDGFFVWRHAEFHLDAKKDETGTAWCPFALQCSGFVGPPVSTGQLSEVRRYTPRPAGQIFARRARDLGGHAGRLHDGQGLIGHFLT